MDCNCDTCKNACNYKPGWFSPEEIEKVAKFFDLTVKETFDKYFGIDWWEEGEDLPETFVIAPATEVMPPGGMYPGNPVGKCIFYKDGKCSIHAVKPNECKFYDHTKNYDDCHENKKSVVREWTRNQKLIRQVFDGDLVTEVYIPKKSLWQDIIDGYRI